MIVFTNTKYQYKMKYALSLFGVAALCITSANAATIAVGRGIGNPGIIAATSGGTALSAGGYSISVGSFATEPTITSDFSSLLAAVASFNTFATLPSPVSGVTVGTITGSFNGNGAPDPTLFNLKPIYFVIENAGEYGIFKVLAGTSFPANVAAVVSTSVTLSSGLAITPLANAGTVQGNNFRLVAIPEPSTMLLGALGALGLLRRRR